MRSLRQRYSWTGWIYRTANTGAVVAVPARILYKLHDSASFAYAAMTEPRLAAFHAIHPAHPEVGENAVGVGVGVIRLPQGRYYRRQAAIESWLISMRTDCSVRASAAPTLYSIPAHPISRRQFSKGPADAEPTWPSKRWVRQQRAHRSRTYSYRFHLVSSGA